MVEGKQREPSREAEEAFERYLAQRGRAGATSFAVFCEQHPVLAEELIELHADWQRIDRILRGLGEPISVFDRLESRFGTGLDPEITLEPDGSASAGSRPGSVPDTVLGELAKHEKAETRYQVRDEIARGGMGVILEVWEQDLRRRLAMKAILAEHRRREEGESRVDERVLARFLEEAQITGQLDHPGIVPVHELGLDAEGRVYFTMPLIRGREFASVIRQVERGEEGWNLTRALRVLLKVCEAVAFAHSKGVIHRDLKPANVMVGRFGETYVMDWGLARVLAREDGRDLRLRERGEDSSDFVGTVLGEERANAPFSPLVTMDGTVIGTPSFMSPEQAEGRIDELDMRTDVYAIGAMLYHLLTHQMPYVPRGERVAPVEILERRLEGPPTPVLELNPDAPGELAEICEKAMATDRERRYANAIELSEDIDNWLSSRPVSAHEASLAYQLRLYWRRNRPIVVTVASAALVLLVATVVFVRHQQLAIEARTRAYDLMSARALPARADELWPALPATIPALETWLAQVDDLESRRDLWEAEVLADDSAARGESEVMLASYESLASLRGAVRDRLELARSLADPDFLDQARDWEQAAQSIAASERYGGLELAPIEGLLPLWENPATGLWEFWSVLSGERPAIDAQAGDVVPREEDGILLVLLPGGTFTMGAGPGEPHFNMTQETHEVELGPVLVARHEVTQAQWTRVMGTNPSHYPAGLVIPEELTALHPGETITALNPVESVNWYDAREFARRIALSLPTEQQWEYACRAGTGTPWFWGAEPSSLEGHENIADEAGATWGATNWGGTIDWDDGFAFSSPVGSYPPNAFGLHDMHGNVSEWCEDWMLDDWIAPRWSKAFRGGSFLQIPVFSRSAFRQKDLPVGLNFARGLRVALTVAAGAE